MQYKKARGVFPRNDFTLSRNAETWIFLVWIIMYDRVYGVPNCIWGGGGRDLLTGVNKSLKMLGFFLYFGKLQSWARQFCQALFINRCL